MKSIIYASVFLILTACSSSKLPATIDFESAKEVAITKLGEPITFKMNTNDTFMLCFNEKEATNLEPRNLISYVVVDLKSGDIIHESNISGGTVKWYDETHLEVKVSTGILKGNDQSNVSTKLIDVISSTVSPVPSKNQR